MKMYKSTVWNADISEIEATGASDDQVVVELIESDLGYRMVERHRFSNHSQYWETKQQAKDHLTNEINKQLEELEVKKKQLLNKLDKVKKY